MNQFRTQVEISVVAACTALTSASNALPEEPLSMAAAQDLAEFLDEARIRLDAMIAAVDVVLLRHMAYRQTG